LEVILPETGAVSSAAVPDCFTQAFSVTAVTAVIQYIRKLIGLFLGYLIGLISVEKALL
jgi:hypothetical protein